MIRLAFERLKHRKLITVIILIAFISIFSLIPVGLEQSKTSTATVLNSIEEHGRGSYDLLVRPPDSRTRIEQKMGIVEENYIGDSSGGISVDEWNDMKDHPDIDVAAPVASLGYFRGQTFSIEFPVLDEPTKFTYQFYTSNGLTDYPLESKQSIMYFDKVKPGQINYLKTKKSGGSSAAMMTIMPENYNLLVAIDPVSESKLTGIDFSDLDNEAKGPFLNNILESHGNPPIMKVLQRDDLNIPIYLDLEVEQFALDIDYFKDLLALQDDQWFMTASEDKRSEAFQEIEQIPPQHSESLKVDLSDFQKPFDGTALLLNEDLEPELTDRSMTDLETSIYYTSSKIDYENLDNIPGVRIETPGSPPSYKEIEQKGVSMMESSLESKELPFITHQTGSFSPETKQQDALVSSPLGIYGDMEATSEDGTTLTPTTEPGSFIPSPASGITDLENAEMVKGEKPIDAIRVKIAGISSYNEAAQDKIENVATELLQKGYEVDVVAGSSYQNMELNVEGIGKVTESWTTLGVAQTLTDTWNFMNLITTLLLGIFSVLWLTIRFTLESHSLVQENETLSIIGWKKSKIMSRNLMEQYIVTTIAFLVSLIILNVLKTEPNMYWTAGALWGSSLLISFIVLNSKEKPHARTEKYKRLASLFYYKKLFIAMMLIACMSLLLIAIQTAALGDAFFKSSETTLGQFISDQTFWFQLIVTILVGYMSVVSFSESLNTLFRERKQEFEMYHVIGWTKGEILKYIFKEALVWFLLASFIGALIAVMILSRLAISGFWILIGLSIAFTVIAVILCIILYTQRKKLTLYQ
ncbi:ABC transporter permease [Lentibacillus sp.]|uniref:ABC transporter permease n=1 Tax=Lentibacillus sp. TaxID=1925746 RepID=UPI002B4AC8DE|nr:ABC transporter permease [Lentibacillus sp.]HLS09803.1 ABC transporter permease [Lentibacillus sp.]